MPIEFSVQPDSKASPSSYSPFGMADILKPSHTEPIRTVSAGGKSGGSTGDVTSGWHRIFETIDRIFT